MQDAVRVSVGDPERVSEAVVERDAVRLSVGDPERVAEAEAEREAVAVAVAVAERGCVGVGVEVADTLGVGRGQGGSPARATVGAGRQEHQMGGGGSVSGGVEPQRRDRTIIKTT